MAQSVSIQNPSGIFKIDLGSFSTSIGGFVDVSIFRNLVELTIRNTNLMTFINGFAGQSLNLTNANGAPISFISGYVLDSDINQKIIGAGSVKKIGAGKLSLKAINSYSGTTEIPEGVLEITTGSLGNGNYSANIIDSATFTVATPTQQTFSGIISGTGVLSVSGDVILNKNNTYTGQTIVISGGKLNISQLTFADLTTSAIVNAGILTFSGSTNIRVPSPISGSGNIFQSGTNRTSLAGTNTNSGTIQVSSGNITFEKIVSLYNGQTINWIKEKIIVNSAGILCLLVGGTGEFTSSEISSIVTNLFNSISNNGFKAGSIIAFDTKNAAGTFTLSDVIPDSTGTGAGSIGLKKLGANILVLSGTNTFTGQVSIEEGVISVSNFNSEGVNGQLGPGIQPIKIGSTTEGTLLYTGAGGATNKQILFDNQGGAVDVSNSAAQLVLNGIVSGAGKFRKLGPGLIELFATNTISGNLLIQVGTIKATNTSSLGISSVAVSNGATLEIINNTSIANNISAEGAGVTAGGAIRSSSGVNTIQGAITSTSGLRIACTLGTLNIQGTLTSGSGGNIDFRVTNGTAVINVLGLISGVTDVLLGTTNGTLVLANNSNNYSGRLQLTDGNCIITSIKDYSVPCSVGASSIGAIQIGNASVPATLIYSGSGDSSNRTIQIGRSLTNTAGETGGATIKASGSGTLTFTAANFNAQINVTTGVGANRTLTLAGTGQGVISGIIRDNLVTAPATGTATISIVKSEAGIWTLSGTNTFTGTTSINAGYLIVANAAALGAIATATTINSGGSLQVQGGITLAAEPLTISGSGPASDGALANLSGTNSVSGAITMAADARINSIAGALTLSGAVNGATRTLTLGGAGTLTISGIITLTTGGIICSGTGTIILSAANAYTGATSINSGVVRISNASALGTAGAITVAPSGQLEISGVITFARAIAISGIGSTAEGSLLNRSGNNTFSGAITLNADSTIGSSVGIFTISGTTSGTARNLILTTASGAEIIASNQIALTTGTLQKTGAGTLTLSGTTSNYTGTTSVLQGILRITSLLSFGTSSEVIVGSGATLQIQPAVAGTFSKLTTISGDGVSNQGALNNTALSNTIGPGVLRVGSSTSNRIASAAALTLTINGITRNESLLAGAAAPLTFGGAGTTTLTGVISTTGASGLSSLTKVDAGTLNLGTLAHVYNGSTTISAGTLTRSVVSGAITAAGNFTTASPLAVTFTGGIPAIGSTWKFFPADTTNTYTAVALTGATGRTGSYNKTTSTLTIS